jgi:hypothetical protein
MPDFGGDNICLSGNIELYKKNFFIYVEEGGDFERDRVHF